MYYRSRIQEFRRIITMVFFTGLSHYGPIMAQTCEKHQCNMEGGSTKLSILPPSGSKIGYSDKNYLKNGV